ncbi:hypothetical protein WN48_00960 [Eufriesea mexicana]|uniref:Uncharacterized protein n=1 Tax=Eufriesea mexicana TaxID=516756 RepID=A0A310SGX5_9HYME|nr:hypothetical protein WN48_00960 [Eufriesea mexicana]
MPTSCVGDFDLESRRGPDERVVSSIRINEITPGRPSWPRAFRGRFVPNEPLPRIKFFFVGSTTEIPFAPLPPEFLTFYSTPTTRYVTILLKWKLTLGDEERCDGEQADPELAVIPGQFRGECYEILEFIKENSSNVIISHCAILHGVTNNCQADVTNFTKDRVQDLMTKNKQRNWRRLLAGCLVVVVVLGLVIAATILLTGSPDSSGSRTPAAPGISLEEWLAGSLSPKSFNGTWISGKYLILLPSYSTRPAPRKMATPRRLIRGIRLLRLSSVA